MPQDNNVPQIVYRPHSTKRIVPGQRVRKVGEERTWTITVPKIKRAVNHILHHTILSQGFLPRSEYQKRKGSNFQYGEGSFSGAGSGGSWDKGTPARVKKEDDKPTVMVKEVVTTEKPTEVSVNNTPVTPKKGAQKRKKATPKLIPIQEEKAPMIEQQVTPMPVNIIAEPNIPETIEVDNYEPIHYTRKMVRDYLRAKGEHPYDFGSLNRKRLRHYLNGDKPVKQKYMQKIQDVVAEPYRDNNTPVTTLTDLQDVFVKR